MRESSPPPPLPSALFRYVDPSYLVRSLPASPSDSAYCAAVAEGAVHAALAGFTAFAVGPVNARYALLPLRCVADRSAALDVRDRTWARVLFSTGQPRFACAPPPPLPAADALDALTADDALDADALAADALAADALAAADECDVDARVGVPACAQGEVAETASGGCVVADAGRISLDAAARPAP